MKKRLFYTLSLFVALALLVGPVAVVSAHAPWSANLRVNDTHPPGEIDCEQPAIAVDAAGNAYAVWMDWRNGFQDIYFAYRPAGRNWLSKNERVSDTSATASSTLRPDIAVDSNGNAYAIWAYELDGKLNIYFSYRPRGGSWGPKAQVSEETPGLWTKCTPAIAVDGAGNAYAIWADARSGDFDIYFSFRPAGGGWGSNTRVNNDRFWGNQFNPALAVDSSGNAYAVSVDTAYSTTANIYVSYRAGGASLGTQCKGERLDWNSAVLGIRSILR